MTFESSEIDVNDPSLMSIDTEEENDAIPEQKKMLIELNQNKFQGF